MLEIKKLTNISVPLVRNVCPTISSFFTKSL